MEKCKIPQKSSDLQDYNELLDQISDSDEEKIALPHMNKAISVDNAFNDLSSYSK